MSERPEERHPICFIICEIGKEGSRERRRADEVCECIIEPIARELGYEPLRADKIEKPGVITNQIVSLLISAEMVVADLTNDNPNVFYELAVRHAARKPVVLMKAPGQRIPFDVHQSRAMDVDISGIKVGEGSKKQLRSHMKAAAEEHLPSENPISVAIDLDTMRHSGKPVDETLAKILSKLDTLSAEFSQALSVANLTRWPLYGYGAEYGGFFPSQGGAVIAEPLGPYETAVRGPVCEVQCTNCHEWWRSPIQFSTLQTFRNCVLADNKMTCPKCEQTVSWDKKNMRFIAEDGSTHRAGDALPG